MSPQSIPQKPKTRTRVVYRKPKLIEMLPLITTLLAGTFAIGNTIINKLDFNRANSAYEQRIYELEKENSDLRYKIAILVNIDGIEDKAMLMSSELKSTTPSIPKKVNRDQTQTKETSTIINYIKMYTNIGIRIIKDNLVVSIITLCMIVAIGATILMIRIKVDKD